MNKNTRQSGQPTEFKSFSAYPKIKFSEEGAGGAGGAEGAEGEDKGIVEHLITVFGVMDMGRDISHPGSFTKTLDERKDRIRVVDSHRRSTIDGVIGIPVKIWEVSRDGLPQEVKTSYPEATGGVMALTQFLLDTPEGKGAYLRIKAGAVSEFSYGYDTLDEDFVKGSDGLQVRNLRTVRLWEYGPVVFGMNQATEVVDVKTVPSAASPEQEAHAPVSTSGLSQEDIKALIQYEEAKAMSYTRHINEVRSAFYLAYNAEQDTIASRYYVKEIFDEYLVVEDSAADYSYYQVNYTKTEESISFTPRGEWVAGKYEFVAVSRSESEDKSEETEGLEGSQSAQSDSLKALEIEIELEQLAISMA